jgi:sugar phosphate isomerase/epimerase
MSECPVSGFVRVPKPRGGERILTVLRPQDGRAYRALVAGAAPVIERSLGLEVAANRVASSDLSLRPLETEWRAFVQTRVRLLEAARVVVQADVTDCYGSIAPDRVERTLLELGAMTEAAGAIRRYLERLQEHGVRGLPVGPDPSAVLANAVLGAVDRSLGGAGFRHVRWVDDVWIAAEDRVHAERALATLRRSLERLGLRVNERKTAVVRRSDLDDLRAQAGGSVAPAGESARREL